VGMTESGGGSRKTFGFPEGRGTWDTGEGGRLLNRGKPDSFSKGERKKNSQQKKKKGGVAIWIKGEKKSSVSEQPGDGTGVGRRSFVQWGRKKKVGRTPQKRETEKTLLPGGERGGRR